MDERIDIADAAAAAVLNDRPVFVDEAKTLFIDSSEWMFVGTEHPLHPEGLALHAEDSVMHLAAFVRDFPTAPLEALYRHARSHGVHGRPSDGWDDVPAAFRIAYAVFRATLIEADRVFAEEEARAAAKALADKAQAPVMVRASETILEQHGTIFEKVGDPDVMVNLGGPVVADKEGGDAGELVPAAAQGSGGERHGEIGDANELVSEPAVAPAASALDAAAAGAVVDPFAAPGDGANAADQPGHAPAAAAGDDGNAEASAPAASGKAPAAGQDGAVASAPAPEAPRADALEAEAKAVSPARRKR